ncbi:MAG TPA: 4-(cytidine 5'-diphospho)-2-C-methyl-D-erythritol kinase [Thermoanaerobaculia bacterium]|jgi:4-diphosphocytidyl-2-C-methyl-D-erythritol kinase|nr:4-(cytidine 5'-diphospho)-2-C-methyl-D-erythritol kinase [Thermoanaerobaculia bacterium]
MPEAFAKINRELRVGGRRPDGFHEIRSRFSTIDLSDTIQIEEADGFELACTGIPVPGGDDNLVARAARALAGHLGISPRVRIRLEKRIPAGAGLGGGSSDAAVTLLALSKLWKPSLPRPELAAIGASLGSDVPFFLFGGEADVEGRGERVFPRPDGPATEVALLIPPFPIQTAAVYSAYSRQTGGNRELAGRLDVETGPFFLGPNDLASAVLDTCPQMNDYLSSAAAAALEAGITGSGSALVLRGLTTEGERDLARRHPEARVLRTATLGRSDYERRASL